MAAKRCITTEAGTRIQNSCSGSAKYQGLFSSSVAPTHRAYCILMSFFLGVLLITAGSVFVHVTSRHPQSGGHVLHTPPLPLAIALILAGIASMFSGVYIAYKYGMDDGDDSLDEDGNAFIKEDFLDHDFYDPHFHRCHCCSYYQHHCCNHHSLEQQKHLQHQHQHHQQNYCQCHPQGTNQPPPPQPPCCGKPAEQQECSAENGNCIPAKQTTKPSEAKLTFAQETKKPTVPLPKIALPPRGTDNCVSKASNSSKKYYYDKSSRTEGLSV